MIKQMYTLDKEGRPVMNINWQRYRRVIYDIRTENVYLNPLIHLIKGEYTFTHNDKTISVDIKIDRGICKFIVKDGDITLMSSRVKNLYKFNKVQIEYWNTFNIPLVYHLIDLGLLNDENLSYYDAALFYPPNMVGRTQWDVMEILPDYYIHKMDDEWCLYHWVSGEKEICMDLYERGPVDMVIDKFRSVLIGMGVKPPSKTSNWSDVTYHKDGTFTLTKCG